ncbi:hypothetical protein AAF712_013993 [Marasmius tenuissimus]|uniref:Thioester reductase (TE) domain-containing protein n=1 Tax=Marasmius tenuissimus TaxID=585030 RepID=A0ABR2ZDH8_9AGAR
MHTRAVLCLAYLTAVTTQAIYRAFLHPLRNSPGPWTAAATYHYRAYCDVVKDEGWTKHMVELHERYEPDTSGDALAKTQLMADLQYSKDLPSKSSGKVDQVKRLGNVVLLTGSTGSLGGHVLSNLIKDSGVQSIYVLIRRLG